MCSFKFCILFFIYGFFWVLHMSSPHKFLDLVPGYPRQKSRGWPGFFPWFSVSMITDRLRSLSLVRFVFFLPVVFQDTGFIPSRALPFLAGWMNPGKSPGVWPDSFRGACFARSKRMRKKTHLTQFFPSGKNRIFKKCFGLFPFLLILCCK